MLTTKSKKAVLTPAAQPHPRRSAKFNVMVWLRPATKAPRGCPSPPGLRRTMRRRQAETGGSG